MPTPSVWTVAVAAPANVDPYAAAEGVTAIPSYAGGGASTAPATAKTRGSWSDAFNPGQPAFWLLVVFLIAFGILHLGGGIKAGVKVEA